MLRALLPQRGTDIRGRLRSHQDLLLASGYADRPDAFAELLRILNREVRLITRTDPEGIQRERHEASGGREPTGSLPSPANGGRQPAGSSRAGHYQLTHDYLVPSLREWLTRKQKETRRGRAELRLEERTEQWTRSPQRRFLPGPTEYLGILWHVRRTQWTDAQRVLLRAATWFYLVWAGAILLAVLLLTGGIGWQWNVTQEQRTVAKLERFLDASPQALPYALDDLRPFQRRAIPKLDRVLADPDSCPQRKLNAALALADFGDPRTEALIDGIVLGTPGLCPNIVGALRSVGTGAITAITERFVNSQDRDSRVRLATVALHLGDPEPARRMLRLAEDPTDRTAFIVGLTRWPGEATALSGFLDDGDAAFRSGLLSALALLPWEDLDTTKREALRTVVERLCCDAPDAGTHSAAVCALTKWNQPLPELPRTAGLPAGQNWCINSQGLPMIRIPAGEFIMGDDNSDYAGDKPAHPVKITRDFFLSDREVPIALFQQFIDETNKDAEYPANERAPDDWEMINRVSPTPNCPAHRVSWFDAVRFCNWLSRKESLPTCYKPVKRSSDDETWDCDLWAGGYRLPTEAEWEYACRAGTTTMFACGDDQAVGEFASFVGNARSRSWPAGLRLPSAWGLFDMHGNLWEWCQDWHGDHYYSASPDLDEGGVAAAISRLLGGGRKATSAWNDPPGPVEGAYRVVRGGNWAVVAEGCRAAVRAAFVLQGRGDYQGFRVAAVPSGGQSSNSPRAKPGAEAEGDRAQRSGAEPPRAAADGAASADRPATR